MALGSGWLARTLRRRDTIDCSLLLTVWPRGVGGLPTALVRLLLLRLWWFWLRRWHHLALLHLPGAHLLGRRARWHVLLHHPLPVCLAIRLLKPKQVPFVDFLQHLGGLLYLTGMEAQPVSHVGP